jgi:hypothetical protein
VRKEANHCVVESKSTRILDDFNEFSDETADSAPEQINRLETQSEQPAGEKGETSVVEIEHVLPDVRRFI